MFSDKTIGIISPTYDWELPSVVKEFLEKASFQTEYLYYVASYGTMPGTSVKMVMERFGKRIVEGGDLYESHQKFLEKNRRYESDGSPNLCEQKEWMKSLQCAKIELNFGEACAPNEIKQRSICVNGDIGEILSQCINI